MGVFFLTYRMEYSFFFKLLKKKKHQNFLLFTPFLLYLFQWGIEEDPNPPHQEETHEVDCTSDDCLSYFYGRAQRSYRVNSFWPWLFFWPLPTIHDDRWGLDPRTIKSFIFIGSGPSTMSKAKSATLVKLHWSIHGSLSPLFPHLWTRPQHT